MCADRSEPIATSDSGHPKTTEATSWLRTSHFSTTRARQWAAHSHPVHELLWGARGTLTVDTAAGFFAVPAAWGLWIPAGVAHTVESAAGTAFFCTYLDVQAPAALADGTAAVTIVPAVRELLLHIRGHAMEPAVRQRAVQLVAELLEPATRPAVQLPMPDDSRLAFIAAGLLERPDDPRSLEQWSRQVGSSPRNLSRLFRQETGLSFAQWRIHARMRAAVRMLSTGSTVAAVSRRVGYRAPSSFVHVFRQTLGTTPGAYVTDSSGSGESELGATTASP